MRRSGQALRWQAQNSRQRQRMAQSTQEMNQRPPLACRSQPRRHAHRKIHSAVQTRTT